MPPGEIVAVGGPIRKDVAGYDLKGLLIGSEGTLGVITAAWLKLLPAPEAALPVVAFHAGTEAGCRAIEAVLGAGLTVAALEYLDGGALAAAGGAFPGGVPDRRRLHGDRRGRRHRGRGRAPPGRARGGRWAPTRSACTRPSSGATWRRCGGGATASRSPSRPGAEGR